MKISNHFRTRVLGVVAALTIVSLALAVAPAHAVDSCRVKVDKRSGLITVAATNLSGFPAWRDGNSTDLLTFFLAGCVIEGNDIVSCPLFDPAGNLASVPPPSCTLCVVDATGNDCCTRIRGCTPGVRDCTTVTETMFLNPSAQNSLSAQCPYGYRATGGGATHIASFANPKIIMTRPTATGDGWIAGGYNDTGGISTLTAYANCCRVP